MKKFGCLILSLSFILSLCACGGTSDTTETQTQTENELWSAVHSVDEFGDIDKDGKMALSAPFVGDFSNTATSSSELTGYVFIEPSPRGDHYYINFRLLEYGNHQATFTDAEKDEIILKTKIDDNIAEYPLIGIPPNSNLVLDMMSGDIVFGSLYAGEDVKCIIYIGTSQYNFTLHSANIVNAFEDLVDMYAEQAEANATHSTTEAVLAFLNDEADSEVVSYLVAHADEFPILNSDELKALLDGNKVLEMTCKYDYWTVQRYSQNTKTQIQFFAEEENGRGYEAKEFKPQEFSIVGDTIVEKEFVYTPNVDYEDSLFDVAYQVRMIDDGIYIVYKLDENSNITEADRMMFLYDGEINSASSLYSVIDSLIAKCSE